MPKRNHRTHIPDARSICFTLLLQWDEERRKADELVAHCRDLDRLSIRDRGLVYEIFFGTIRRKRRIDFFLDALCKKGLSSLPRPVCNILRLGASQILYLG